MNNLQFLSENGRIHKFANSFCSLAFMLQEYNKQHNKDYSVEDDLKMLTDKENVDVIVGDETRSPSPSSGACTFDSQNWNNYVAGLSAVLCSFLLSSEDTKLPNVQTSTARSNLLVSSAYMDLSVKWFLRVLLTVFPCIRACSNQNEMPSHLRCADKLLKFLYLTH